MEAASLILSIEYGSILFQSGEKQKATILTIANKNTVHSWDLPPGNDGLESILCLPWLYIYMQHYIYCSDYDYWKGVAFFLPGDFHCNPRFLNSTEAVVSINLLGMCAWFFFRSSWCSSELTLFTYFVVGKEGYIHILCYYYAASIKIIMADSGLVPGIVQSIAANHCQPVS